jgi:hypothetical protein
LKRSDHITSRAELIIKSAAPRVFVWFDYLVALFVVASCVVCPPHIRQLAQSLAAARYSLFVFICHPTPKNLRSLGAR